MIIVCDNTDIAELFYRKISGEEVVEVVEENADSLDFRSLEDFGSLSGENRRKKPKTKTVYGQGQIFPELLSNTERQRRTLRIDNKMLAEAESEDPNVSKQQVAEELRNIVKTIGKPGKPGEQIRCVVSKERNQGRHPFNGASPFGTRIHAHRCVCQADSGFPNRFPDRVGTR